MEKFIQLPRLQKPCLIGLLTLHYIYVISPSKKVRDISPYNIKEIWRVRVDQIQQGIYLLNEVDEKGSPTDSWIQMTHEDLINKWIIIEAITAREELIKLSISMPPHDIKF